MLCDAIAASERSENVHPVYRRHRRRVVVDGELQERVARTNRSKVMVWSLTQQQAEAVSPLAVAHAFDNRTFE